MPATIGPTGFGGAFLAGPAAFGASSFGGTAFNGQSTFAPTGFGGTFFTGPGTFQTGPLAFSAPGTRAFDLARANLINRSESILARQNTLFGTGLSPVATNFNNFTGPAALNTGPSALNFSRANLFSNTAGQNFMRPNLFNNFANQNLVQTGVTRVNPLDALLASQRSQFGARVTPFSNRPFFSTFNNVNLLPNTFNQPVNVFQNATPVSGLIPTNPTYPLSSNGFYNIVQTPGGPAGLR